jgi:hypothetical protein
VERALEQIRDKSDRSVWPDIADAVELTLLGHPAQPGSLGVRLEDLRVEMRGPEEFLASQWMALTENEALSFGVRAPVERALRLLRGPTALTRQMGLRSLRRALDVDSTDRTALQLFSDLASDGELPFDYDTLSELLPLFRAHFSLLNHEVRLEFAERLLERADSSRASRYLARDWINALSSYLGPREEAIRLELEKELGPAREAFESPRVVAAFVAAKGPVAAEDVAALPAQDVVSLLTGIPVVRNTGFRDSSMLALADLLKAEVERRPEEFLPTLQRVAQEIGYPAVLYNLIWALQGAFAAPDRQLPHSLDVVMAFLSTVVERASRNELDEDGSGLTATSVLKAVADFIDERANWVLEAEAPQLLALLDSLLATAEPTAEYERQYGGSNMDPPTLALNTARGRATRALLKLASLSWSDAGEAVHGAALDERVRIRAREEPSPSVASSFGLFLTLLVLRAEQLWREVEPTILPATAGSGHWDAVFTTYVVFNWPNRIAAARMQDSYATAIDRLGDSDYPYLLQHGDRLIAHLVALAMPGDAESGAWLGELLRALDLASDETAAASLRALEWSLTEQPREDLGAWVRSLARARLTSVADSDRPNERSAVAGLLLATNLPVDVVGPDLLALLDTGAEPELESVVTYLIAHERTVLSAQILESSLRHGLYKGWLSEEASIRELVASYADRAPTNAWSLVNALGEVAFYDLEELARALRARLDDQGVPA